MRVDGQTLDLDAQVALRLLNLAVSEIFETLPIVEGRAQIASEAWIFDDARPDVRVHDLTIPGPGGDPPAWMYRPEGIDGPSAALVYFHGGGWVLGDLGASDAVSRARHGQRHGCGNLGAGGVVGGGAGVAGGAGLTCG